MTDCFDECATARPGISNLTGVMLRAKGLPVNPSIMSEAGDGTVELLVPVLCGLLQNNVKRSASWRARLAVWCSSLTCGSGPADSQNQMPREVRLTAPPNEVASQSQTFSKRVAKQNQPRLTRRLLGGSSGHQGLLFSIDRPPLLAVGLRRRGNWLQSEQFKRTADEPLCPDLLSEGGVPASDEA